MNVQDGRPPLPAFTLFALSQPHSARLARDSSTATGSPSPFHCARFISRAENPSVSFPSSIFLHYRRLR
jgi:hypothetical protein